MLVNGVRRLTPRENLRLQGFPDTFKIAVSDGEIRKQAGNSVTVPVIEAVARQMMSAIKESRLSIKQSDLFLSLTNGQYKQIEPIKFNAKDKVARYTARKRSSRVAKAS